MPQKQQEIVQKKKKKKNRMKEKRISGHSYIPKNCERLSAGRVRCRGVDETSTGAIDLLGIDQVARTMTWHYLRRTGRYFYWLIIVVEAKRHYFNERKDLTHD